MEQVTIEVDAPPNEEEQLVREWRVGQLERLGVSRIVAAMFADLIDWHEIAMLVRRGCSPELAIEIVR